MRRRHFLGTLGGAALLWPLSISAQKPEHIKRVGILTSQVASDQEAKNRVAAIRDGLRKLGWVDGRNIVIDVRYGGGGTDLLRARAHELVQLNPDVIVASATTALAALQKATSTIPIVFAQVTDPVGAGFVDSLARPGGNITGFTQHEFSIAVKWLELLKELAPQVDGVGVFFDPDNPATKGYLDEIKKVAPTFSTEILELSVPAKSDSKRTTSELENAFEQLGLRLNSGIIVLPGPGPSVGRRRDQLVKFAERHRLPAVYPFRYWINAGGLAFYGIDNIQLHRSAVIYVDRILKGEKPDELPVQNATKFMMVLNLRAAKKLGIQPPIALLARADEVIE